MNYRKLYFKVIAFFLLLIPQIFVLPKVAQAATPIMGQSQTAKDQMIKYYQNNNSSYPYATNPNVPTIQDFVQTTINEANYEGVRAEVAFALMMKETGFLKFGGRISVNQYNFGGLGATDSGDTIPASFSDPIVGIRAVVQHLKAYASTAPLNQPCVDPRFSMVNRGIAPNVEDLSGKWASDPNYGSDLVNRINIIKSIPSLRMCVDAPINGSIIRGTSATISGWALDGSGSVSIDVFKSDGSTIYGTPQFGLSRPDVNAVFPGYPNGDKSGFSFTFSTSALGSRYNTLKVTAVGNDGTTAYGLVTIKLRGLVVIDPGHGGSDPGAIANGIWEKDVNLAVALKLRDILNSQGIDVFMTRDRDVTVDLDDRPAISNEYKDNVGADLFVSIHSNASSNPNIAYVLGTYFDINSGWAVGTTDYDPVAAGNWQLSKDLAEKIAYSLGGATGQPVRIESHSYVVLKYNKLPATLVELGFLSNPYWASNLSNPTWQWNAAASIANGIRSWLDSHASP